MATALNIHNPDLRPAQGKRSLAGMHPDDLKAALAEFGIEAKKLNMRERQISHWLYHYGVKSIDEMTTISKKLRADLAEHFTVDRPEIVERLISADGTRKYLIRFAPGVEAETVFIPDVTKSGALCVSSQVGCTLTCKFCHTGTQKLVRNLTAQEIAAQVMIARDDLEEWPTSNENRKITNVVFMGMGEPLYNLDNVAKAIDVISDSAGMAIGRRRVTVSTSGVVPQIVPLGERTRTMLAISLHAATDDLRTEIMPINKKYPLDQLMEACRNYPGLNNSRRITFEYVMLKGINDSLSQAQELIDLLRGIPAKINLIPFNPWPGSDYECSDWDTIEAFADKLNRAGYASPIRTPRGRDIFAACGQLKSESEKMRASERRKLYQNRVTDAYEDVTGEAGS